MFGSIGQILYYYKKMATEMSYIKKISEALRADKSIGVKVLDLFAGCGGLSLGFEAVGFDTIGFEVNKDACDSYNRNLRGECYCTNLSLNSKYPEAEILIAGPPCQPYSVAGRQNGAKDKRNGFPVFIDAIEKVQPAVCIFENVKGMVYKNKHYLERLIQDLNELGYNVKSKIINAKDYYVPQTRERLFVVGFKERKSYDFPTPIGSAINVRTAIGNIRTKVPKDTIVLNSRMDNYIRKYEIASNCVNPRDISFTKPSRTVTCRNLSGCTGDMMRVKLKDGTRRTLSVREAATIQSFPSWFRLSGSVQSKLNQIGNAVPPMVSYHIALSIKQQFCS